MVLHQEKDTLASSLGRMESFTDGPDIRQT